MEKPSATFWNGKYSVLKNFCYAELLAYCTLKSGKIFEYQPEEIDDNLIENNHSYPKKIKLTVLGETMRIRIVRRILRYHVPNKLLLLEKLARHVLFLFFSIHK